MNDSPPPGGESVTAKELLERASDALERSGPVLALDLTDRALLSFPNDAQLHNFRAVALCRENRLGEAFTELIMARALDPTVPIFHLNLNTVAGMLGMDEIADDFFRDYLDVIPKSCPYFPDRQRGKYEAVRLSRVPFGEFDDYLARGWRRTGSTLSRYVCPDCPKCVQTRVPLDTFDFRKWKRVMKANADCEIREPPYPIPQNEHVDLLSRYLRARHRWKTSSFANEAQELHFGFENARMIETRLGDKLIAVAIADEGKNDLYAAASYYDPDLPKRSLGFLNVINMISFGRKRGKGFLYLGEAIDGVRNMEYKKRFTPRQCLCPDGEWKDGSG